MINVTAGLAGSSVTVDQPLSKTLSPSLSLPPFLSLSPPPSSQTIRKLLTDRERVPLTLRRVNCFKGRLAYGEIRVVSSAKFRPASCEIFVFSGGILIMEPRSVKNS